jgi:hypothetical protein
MVKQVTLTISHFECYLRICIFLVKCEFYAPNLNAQSIISNSLTLERCQMERD